LQGSRLQGLAVKNFVSVAQTKQYMKSIKIVLLYGLLGGLSLIVIHFLEYKLYYIAGLLVPFVFLLIMWLALRNMYKLTNSFNFALFYKIAISVFVISYLINIIFIVYSGSAFGNDIIAYLLVAIFGLISSYLITLVFKFWGISQ